MKKYFLTASLFLVCFLFVPKSINAQIYNPYPAMIDTTLTNQVNTIMTRKAMQRKAAMKAKHRRAAKKKNVRRRSRRVSKLENPITLKLKFDADLTRKSELA